jgi:hypothetical protein
MLYVWRETLAWITPVPRAMRVPFQLLNSIQQTSHGIFQLVAALNQRRDHMRGACTIGDEQLLLPRSSKDLRVAILTSDRRRVSV